MPGFFLFARRTHGHGRKQPARSCKAANGRYTDNNFARYQIRWPLTGRSCKHLNCLLRTAQSVGYFIQSVLQGSFIFAKAQQSPEVVRENLVHLRRYLRVLFGNSRNTHRKEKS
jgi:hypothetical protein